MGHDGVASGYLTPTFFFRLTGCQRDPRDRGVTPPLILSHLISAQSSLILRNITLWWDVFSTCLLLALALLIRLASCLSSCTSQPLRIRVLLSGSSTISIVLWTIVLFFIITLHLCFMHSLMPIRQGTKMISPLLVHSLFILVGIPFLGSLRNNMVLLILPWNQNID